MLYQARLFHNLERKIGHEIFVKIEKAEYISHQLTYAYFDQIFIFPIKNQTFEQIFIFRISKMFQISKSRKKLINIHILDTSVLKFHIFLFHFISCLFTNFSRQQLLGDLIQKHLVRQVKNPRTPICLKTPLVQEDPPAYPRVPFHCHPQVIIFIFCLLSCLLLVYF